MKPDRVACYRHHDPEEPVSSECILHGLMTKALGALNDPPAKRAALEDLASYVAKTGHGLGLLSTLLESLMGIGKDSEQVLRHVATLQTSTVFPDDTAAAVRTQTTKSGPLAPWEPGQARAKAGGECLL